MSQAEVQTVNSNGMRALTMAELEQIEESAHKSGTAEAKIVLRLSAALREALQAKENADALVALIKSRSSW